MQGPFICGLQRGCLVRVAALLPWGCGQRCRHESIVPMQRWITEGSIDSMLIEGRMASRKVQGVRKEVEGFLKSGKPI